MIAGNDCGGQHGVMPSSTQKTLAPALSKLALLSTLYFSQGLPFGFFTQALPVWMRQSGMSLPLIGASSLLALPWALKFLWAPLVDRHAGSPLGRRRGWILPLQAAAIASALALAALGALGDGAGDAVPFVGLLAVGMFVTNLFAATQDIATDGLAVDLLSSEERGLGNGVQVAAYRVGMIVGGGALLVALGVWGWTPTFVLMAALLAVMTVPLVLHREQQLTMAATPTEKVSLAAAWHFLGRKNGQMIIWCLAIGFYKFGDGFGSAMVRPFLVDRGWSVEDIGLLVGTLGSLGGMIGALLGGLLARRGRLLALIVCGLVHAALMAGYAWGVGDVDVDVVAGLLIVEHLTGGMATVALFTAMMDASDPKTGATDYTVQASVVVFASGLASAVSGVSAQQAGYAVHFVISGGLCLLGTLAMWPLYRMRIAPHDPAFDDELRRVPLPAGALSSSSTVAVATHAGTRDVDAS